MSVLYDKTLLTNDDLFLFNEGSHFHLQEKLGAHITTSGGKEGTYFAVWAPDAEGVFVMGDFNGWNPKTHPMKSDGNGMWKKTVMIPPGKYEYKFLADGQWREDPKNNQRCPNYFGTSNSILNLVKR